MTALRNSTPSVKVPATVDNQVNTSQGRLNLGMFSSNPNFSALAWTSAPIPVTIAKIASRFAGVRRKGHMLSTLKSIGAVLAGALVGIILSLGTDILLRQLHIFPPLSQPMNGARLLALATAYRTIYAVLGAYVTAWLAPSRPMLHAIVLGTLGLLASLAGVIATWNNVAEYGPHWYPIALVVLALPPAWLGAWLYERRARSR
jgi:hypothetical protein